MQTCQILLPSMQLLTHQHQRSVCVYIWQRLGQGRLPCLHVLTGAMQGVHIDLDTCDIFAPALLQTSFTGSLPNWPALEYYS